MPSPAAPAAFLGEHLPVSSTRRNAQRLVWLRWFWLPGLAVGLLLTRHFYGLAVALVPLAVIVGVLGLFNLGVWWRLGRSAAVPEAELFLHMLADLLALTALLYVAGGATNPFVLFFLLPVTITAAILPQSYTWAMAAVSAGLYTLLLLLPPGPADNAHEHRAAGPDLHVLGMWVGFVLIAGVIAQFVAAMAATVRQQDRRLAALREQALRDERVMALATLAAGAAHELSTPLATMAVVTGELRSQYPARDFGPLHQQLAILGEQVVRCKEALSVISASAGAARADSAVRMPLDRFVGQVAEEVRRLRPGARLAVDIQAGQPVPELVVERTLRQALLNVLHNAVDASPGSVSLRCRWSGQRAELVISDHGPGFGSGAPPKEGGLGLGLFLTEAALARLGGGLHMTSQPDGGTTVTLDLPLPALGDPAP